MHSQAGDQMVMMGVCGDICPSNRKVSNIKILIEAVLMMSDEQLWFKYLKGTPPG